MAAPLIPLNAEIDDLNEAENIIKATIDQHCTAMIYDIIAYSPDSYGDLLKVKTHLVRLAESHKEIVGIIHGINEINSLTDKTNLTEKVAIKKFEKSINEYVEENDIDEYQQYIISSIDSVINDEHEEQESETEKDDSELLVTKETQSYKDPVTQNPITDPVRSTICNHSYERDSILAYLGESRKKCPYSGCQSTIGKKDLVDHYVLKIKLNKISSMV